ncbi:low temperature requirement protein A [Cellulomonas sp. ICMP 17802]|uniref:low temperature requirement protein A n=1 Tax=Cellulomonas sp. ICMP 17802 TaxID=3239199 RepID=UPI00351BC8D7
MTAAEPVEAVERHASWKELFFDLVVVAGIGQLAHLLHEDMGSTTLGLYAVLYLAFWISWAGFAVYGNIAGDDARTRVLITAMIGLAVMAAAVPGIHGARAAAFVVAYVVLRWLAGAVFSRGKVVLDWPLAQYGLGAVPWLVSLWVAAPARYWLWAAGIVIDLVVLLTASSARTMQNAEEKLARAQASPRRGGPGNGRTFVLEGAHTQEEHLAERLGLFVIIVLGEGLIQIIDAAAGSEEWDRSTAVVALGAFALLASVWAAGLLHGIAGIPQLKPHVVAPRIVMLLHALLTGALAALAAALGIAVEHTHGDLPVDARALLCAAVAAYCAIGVVTAILVGTSRAWLLVRGVPSVVVPVVLLLVGSSLSVAVLVWALVAVVVWLALQPPEGGRRPR